MSTDDFTVIDFTGKVLNKDEIQDRILELRKLILEDNKFKNIRTDDAYLLRFLHCTAFDVPLAFKWVQDFHNLILENTEWFTITSPLEKKKQIQENTKAMLKSRDKQGRCIYLAKLGKVDPRKSSPQEQAQIDQLWYESVLDDPKTQANGMSVIMDMKGYSWKAFKWLTPENLKIGTKMADVFPCKEVVFHVVNTSFLISASIKIAWPFLSETTKKRIKFHFEDWPSLHEYISPDLLPPEYGGTGPEIDFDKLNEWLFDQDSEIRKKLEFRRIISK